MRNYSPFCDVTSPLITTPTITTPAAGNYPRDICLISPLNTVLHELSPNHYQII